MARAEALNVDGSNTEQARAWDGGEGDYWAVNDARFDRSLIRYHTRFMQAADIAGEATVLDVGCGTGQTTREAARMAPSGSALGVDLSARMLEVARRLAEQQGIENVRFEQADAQIHPFERSSFDVAISRTSAMFFGDPAAAFANIERALRPGGRLVLLVWQDFGRNEWIREISTAFAAGRDLPLPPAGAQGPFALSDPDRIRLLLTGAGFSDVRVDGLSEPMVFGDEPDDALELILGTTGWMLEGLDGETRTQALDSLRTTLGSHRSDEGVAFGSATWLVTADKR